MPKLNADFPEQVKRLAIKAMFSDDDLMDRLVLKGGNLLAIVYGITIRSSADIDFSFDGEPWKAEILKTRIERALKTTFAGIGYEAFDVNLHEKPPVLTADLAGFWGGYQVDFKLIELSLFKTLSGSLEQLRRNAAGVGQRGATKFEIDISKHEYCEPKQRLVFENFTIYAYTPAMEICEKLRAICQQMPEYGLIVKRNRNGSARARDFVDIHTIVERIPEAFDPDTTSSLLSKIFQAKKVPRDLLCRIEEFREFHRPDFAAVVATI